MNPYETQNPHEELEAPVSAIEADWEQRNRTAKFVGVNFTSECKMSGRIKNISRCMTGCDGMLSEYGQKAEDLAE
jgi:hypothetical protein